MTKNEIIDHDTMTTSGLQGYLASYKALGVFHYGALEEKLEGESLAMIHHQTYGNAKNGCTCESQEAKSVAEAALKKWEGDLLRLQKDFDVKVKDDMRVAILLEMMPVSITEVLCQHVKQKPAFPSSQETLDEVLGDPALLRRCEAHGPEPRWRTSARPAQR